MNGTVLFLLGYPLAIVANFSTTFLQEYFKGSDTNPLKSVFVESFIYALNENKKKVDDIGKEAITDTINVIKKDKNQLLRIIEETISSKHYNITEFRNKEYRKLIEERIQKKFNLSHVSLSKAVLNDCLRNYEESFYSRMSTKDGLKLIINLLNKIDSDIPRKSDLVKLKSFIKDELHKLPKQKIDDIGKLVFEEISSPVSNKFSQSIIFHFNQIKKNVKQLTDEQYQILHFLKYRHRVSISGCAGSGKTLIAAEKAIRLDNAGIKTLFLAHNPHLVEHIKRLVSGTGVEVIDFTNLIYKYSNTQELKSDSWNEFIEPVEEELYSALNRILEENVNYEAIIIDEAQDFRESWWIIVEGLLSNSRSNILYIFYDDNQSLLPFRSKYPIEESPFNISKNCRNSGNIFDIVKRFHREAPLVSSLLKDSGIFKLDTFVKKNVENIVVRGIQEALKHFEIESIKLLTNEPSIETSTLKGIEVFKNENLDWSFFIFNEFELFHKKAFQRINSLKQNRSISEIKNRFSIPLEVDIEEYLSLPIISKNKSPTKSDIKAVSQYAQRLLPFFEGKKDKNALFRKDRNSIVVKEHTPETRKEINAKIASRVYLYSTTNWNITLPLIKPISIGVKKDKKSNENLNIYNIDRYKGLESECIILFINSINKDIIKELYVGSSRAISYLHILINKQVYEKIHEMKDVKTPHNNA